MGKMWLVRGLVKHMCREGFVLFLMSEISLQSAVHSPSKQCKIARAVSSRYISVGKVICQYKKNFSSKIL